MTHLADTLLSALVLLFWFAPLLAATVAVVLVAAPAAPRAWKGARAATPASSREGVG